MASLIPWEFSNTMSTKQKNHRLYTYLKNYYHPLGNEKLLQLWYFASATYL